ncbi:DUF3772 domain-containing protein [Fluviibacterium sp. DFM31]|uniref:DUF3772 domain-containing protein n=1 Tax=Meridianimarinicoccus marinus TaxID=3231483 RepID=A0ABV3L8F0_9RHOB
MLARIAARARLAAMLVLLLAAPLSAQNLSDKTFADWESMAVRVERVLEANTADDATLERLRNDLAGYREQFLTAQGANETQVQRIERQIEALGPAPAEGEVEAEEVANRRAALNEQLLELRQPILRATEAFVEADGLVSEIDAVLRDRQARQVLKRYPSPVNPLNWGALIGDFSKAFGRLPSEVILILRDEHQRQTIIDNLPSAVLSLLAGLYLLFRSRHWLEKALSKTAQIRNRLLQHVVRVVMAAAQLVLPWTGLGLLLVALQLTGLFGLTGSALLAGFASFGFMLISGIWLTRHLFPKDGPDETPLRLQNSQVSGGRMLSRTMVLTMALEQGLSTFSQRMQFTPQTEAYVGLILSFICAYALLRMGRLFRQTVAQDISKDHGFSNGVVNFLGLAGMFMAVSGPVAGVAGYAVLSKQLVFSTAGTFLVFGLIALLHREFKQTTQMYRASRGMDEADEGLAPTLVGAMLIFLSLPLIALIWGARVTDLTEIWAKVREGFTIGEIQLSPTVFFTLAVAFAAGFGLTRLVQGALRNTVLPKTRLDLGARTAIVSGVGYIGYFLAAIVSVTLAGIDLSNLAILASALAVGIGFGLQTIVSNFVSGIILLVERPVSEGDWIEVGGVMGYVRRISVRATRIETFDRTDVIIPNADLVSGQVTNWTRGNLIGRVIVPVGVAYGTDTRKVEKILLEIANEHPMVVISPPPSVYLMGFGADSVDFEIRAILRDINFMLSVKSDMNHEIARRFAGEDIEIPFAQRDLWLRNPEALSELAAPGIAPKVTPMMPPPAQTRGADPEDGPGDDPD